VNNDKYITIFYIDNPRYGRIYISKILLIALSVNKLLTFERDTNTNTLQLATGGRITLISTVITTPNNRQLPTMIEIEDYKFRELKLSSYVCS